MTLRLFTLAAGALALSMATASAQNGGDVLDMTDWDQNDDQQLSPEEFTAGHELHSTPRDDYYFRDAETLTREDFVAGEFERFDLDDDGVIDDVEFGLWRLAQ